MPLAHVEIEQLRHDRWVGSVEAQDRSLNARRATVSGSSFVEVMARVDDAYHELSGEPRPEMVAEIKRQPMSEERRKAIGQRLAEGRARKKAIGQRLAEGRARRRMQQGADPAE